MMSQRLPMRRVPTHVPQSVYRQCYNIAATNSPASAERQNGASHLLYCHAPNQFYANRPFYQSLCLKAGNKQPRQIIRMQNYRLLSIIKSHFCICWGLSLHFFIPTNRMNICHYTKNSLYASIFIRHSFPCHKLPAMRPYLLFHLHAIRLHKKQFLSLPDFQGNQENR